MTEIPGCITLRTKFGYWGIESLEYIFGDGPTYLINPLTLPFYVTTDPTPINWKKDGTFKMGPYEFYVLEWTIDGFVCLLKTPLWRMRVIQSRMSKLCELIYRRLIWTLAVWNLAQVPEGALPTYKYIYGHRRMRALIRRVVRRMRILYQGGLERLRRVGWFRKT